MVVGSSMCIAAFQTWLCNATQQYVKLNMYIEPDQKDELFLKFRTIWIGKVARYFRIPSWNSVDIHWQYRAGRASVLNRMTYAMRSPVFDLYLAVKAGYVDKVWASRLLLRKKKEKRTQWYGLSL
ncbi:MAG: hypothetical protein JRN67_01160 [Nitrososphaerota archaeon]|nr:hypothetical protein [Nitrososphaerota archaeon]